MRRSAHAFEWTRRRNTPAILTLSAILLASCGGGSPATPIASPAPVSTPPPVTPPAGNGASVSFTEQAASRGLAMRMAFSSAVTGMPREFAGGAAAGDVDGDGDIDLVILRGDTQSNLLMINDGTGRFEDVAPPALAWPKGGTETYRLSGPVLADMDGDGALDLFVGGLNGDPHLVLRGDGRGGFTDVSAGSGLEGKTSLNTISAAFGDVDGDGRPDMVQAHWGTPRDMAAPGETETLWRNLSTPGTIRFEAATVGSGITVRLDSPTGVLGTGHDYTFAPILTDIDGDRDADLYMVADFGGTRVFENDGTGLFTDVTDTTQITDRNGMGAAVGDVDNDGDPDAFVSSINDNQLYTNRDGQLSNATARAGLEVGGWGWGSCMADVDLDGDLDIYQTNGWVSDAGSAPQEPYTQDRTRLWLGDGTGVFADAAQDAGIADSAQGRGVVCADLDGDMDIDIVQLLSASDPGLNLWINMLEDGRGVTVTASSPDANSQGLGAVVSVTSGGRTQVRELRVGSNFTSHDPAVAVFGLGDDGRADVTITWPDGRAQSVSDVEAGTALAFDSANGR